MKINKYTAMKPTKSGQIVRFHTPLQGENPEQLYVVLELHQDAEKPRAKIQALNSGLPFAPVNIVIIDDLEVAEVSTMDLVGQIVHIKKPDLTKVLGRVIAVNTPQINLDMSVNSAQVETNVVLTIVDKDGESHEGNLVLH